MDHSYDVDQAKKYGIEEAVLLKNFIFWISKNRANKRHFYDGRYWTYNSVSAFSELFPEMTKKQIRNALDSLVNQNVIIKGNYNKSPYIKTCWYALTDESMLKSIKEIKEYDKES